MGKAKWVIVAAVIGFLAVYGFSGYKPFIDEGATGIYATIVNTIFNAGQQIMASQIWVSVIGPIFPAIMLVVGIVVGVYLDLKKDVIRARIPYLNRNTVYSPQHSEASQAPYSEPQHPPRLKEE
jgi:hypothetical protein